MTINDFVTILHRVIVKNGEGRPRGKGPFLRYLISLNLDETERPRFMDSPDNTFNSYLTRGFSKQVASEILSVMEQSRFKKEIDDLGDESQMLLFELLQKYDVNADYENLSDYCANKLRELICKDTCKEMSNNFLDDCAMAQGIFELDMLKKYWNNPRNVQIIHYACTDFNDPVLPARITCIAVRPLTKTETKTFSILNESMDLHLSVSEISNNLDRIEGNMLMHFFEFIQSIRNPVWFHWNMRDSKYGFEAIVNRCKCLLNDHDKNTSCIENENIFCDNIDLGDYLKRIYGCDYADHPRLQNICSLNRITMLNFITGNEEAIAFRDGNYNMIINSTLRKLSCIHAIVQMCVEGTLKTKH